MTHSMPSGLSLLLLLLPSALAAAPATDWRFVSSYPKHHVSYALRSSEAIVVDGVLDEPAWAAVAWTSGFVDIAQKLHHTILIPESYQTRIKVRWDAEFVYVAAELNEPLIWGNVTGHNDKLTNGKAPWWNVCALLLVLVVLLLMLVVPRVLLVLLVPPLLVALAADAAAAVAQNDFEAFFDVSGSTHFYKEYEMSVRNATYDVLWRVPDGGFASVGVPCNASVGAGNWCQNSTYNLKADAKQTWTMVPAMRSATSVGGGNEALVPFEHEQRRQFWVAEVAFPLAGRQDDSGVGGLLSCGYDGPRHGFLDCSQYHPSKGSASKPVYWWVDFARAEHPLETLGKNALSVDFMTPSYAEMCARVQKKWPSLLGTTAWSCYWEFVWVSLPSC